ncbi:MAG: YdcF family protein [Thermodesulfobacteriota bacterium]
MAGQKRQVPDRSGTGRRRIRRPLLLLALLLAPPAVPHLLALRIPPPPSIPCDAVFVLTGGQGRIQEGYRIWSSGSAKELCILGAGRNAKPERLLPDAAGLPPGFRSRIRVEGWSENTLENAISAKSIAEERKYASVILVTSDYHVPRAHLAFRKMLPPEVSLSVSRVRAEGGDPAGVAWRWARRHFIEGWKYWSYRILLHWE